MSTKTTITSANSVFVLSALEVFPSPQRVQGYAVDEAFDVEALDIAETQMGVDGRLTAGYIPQASVMTISLQADSPSVAVFDAIVAASQSQREIIWLDGTISLPATRKSYTLTRGTLTKAKQLPGAKKVLQAQTYTITWESINPAVL